MKKLLFIILAGLLIFQLTYAHYPPKREMRANWLATVWRLDWPSVTVPAGGTESQRLAAINQQKADLIKILDRMKTANMNTVFFQIRSMSDAMYHSSFENWSSFISSERGADPGWDPLEFAVAEAHKRGMELHAWINPYRYSSSSATHGNLPTDYVNTKPEWLINYDSYTKILNPGIPEVTQRITDIVAEVVTKYDVDGIVFDDYFYGNGITLDSQDQAQYDLYNPDGLLRGDWRRENCNKMIKAVYNRIQEIKPYVTFGVSPAGVAASNPVVAEKYGVPPAPVGSDWQYNGIYSDPLAWLSQGTVDYISPQLYWTTTSSIPYDKLAVWWSMVANKFSKHFYSSHSLTAMTGAAAPPAPMYAPQEKRTYKVLSDEISETGISELERNIIEQYASVSAESTMQKAPDATNYTFPEVGIQVEANRTSDLNGAPGSVFYATTKATGQSFVDYLKANVFTRPSIPPSINWKKASALNLVDNLALNAGIVTWTHERNDVKFAVYAVPIENSNDPAVYSTSAYLLGVSYAKQYTLPSGISTLTHKIAVSALDRYRNETAPGIVGEALATATAAQLIYPENNSQPIIPALFKWSAVAGADSYVWEVAEDNQFDNLICARETAVNQFPSGLQTNILENKTYYWRVKTRKANAPDIYSQVFSFNGTKFKITSPADGATGVLLTPSFEWMSLSPTAQYTLEISTSALFQAANQVFSQTLSATTFTLPDQILISEKTYFARVKVVDGLIQATSEVISFKTMDLEIPVPVIFSPANGAEIFATTLRVEWAPQNSKGFLAELSQNNTFPPRATKAQRTDAFVYTTDYTGLSEGTYFVRVSALNNTGTTNPSPFITVYMKSGTDVKSVFSDNLIKTYLDAENNLHIQLNEQLKGELTASVYSITGTLVYTSVLPAHLGEKNYKLSLKNYSKGIYVVKLTAGNTSSVAKFILQ